MGPPTTLQDNLPSFWGLRFKTRLLEQPQPVGVCFTLPLALTLTRLGVESFWQASSWHHVDSGSINMLD